MRISFFIFSIIVLGCWSGANTTYAQKKAVVQQSKTSECIFSITCLSPKGKALANELLTFENTKTKEQHTVTSDIEGKAHLTLPMGNYDLHLTESPNYQTFKSNPKLKSQTFDVQIVWIGAAAQKFKNQQEAEKEKRKQAAKEEADKKRLVETIASDLPLSFISTSDSLLEDLIWKKAAAYKQRLAADPKYFHKKQKHILIHLPQLLKLAPNANILLDLGDYDVNCLEQVLIWYALNEGNPLPKYHLLDADATHKPPCHVDAKGIIRHIISASTQKFKPGITPSAVTTIAKLTENELGKSVIFITRGVNSDIIAKFKKLGVTTHILINNVQDNPDVRACGRMDVDLLQLAYITKGTVSYCTNRHLDFNKINTNRFNVQGYWTAKLDENGLIDYEDAPVRR